MKTVILLRHADIDPPPGPAPDTWPLNAAGNARAEELVHVVGSAGVTAVFASPASRTQQTAGPLLAELGLPLRVPSPFSTIVTAVLSDEAGGVVVVVGHSNTVPEIITTLGAPFIGPPLNGHDDLFIVTVLDPGHARLVRLKYGGHSP
jgi:broad specificity phosphatase PhoE